MKEFFNKNFTYAIIGASNNPNKYGNIVLKDLQNADFKIIPVNLKEKEIEGMKAYAKVSDISEKVDVAVIIVPPNITENILKDVKLAGIDKVWMQPGSESENAVKYCEENNINCVHNNCIMVKKSEYI